MAPTPSESSKQKRSDLAEQGSSKTTHSCHHFKNTQLPTSMIHVHGPLPAGKGTVKTKLSLGEAGTNCLVQPLPPRVYGDALLPQSA